jgi:alkaline phosphatase D
MATRGVSRRDFLLLGAATVGAAGFSSGPATDPPSGTGSHPGDPFTLGVASGDPTPSGVVLWTRLAPDPLHGGGMPDRPVIVDWEIAADERFRRVVHRGSEHAVPSLGHSVHAEVEGLDAGRWYWYRFHAEGATSPAGRTRTAPAHGAAASRLAFASTSCQSLVDGWFTAHAHLAQEDLDLVVHLGDYIYEGAPDPSRPRVHEGQREPTTLVEYRNRHAQYKGEPELQAAHAAFPWAVLFDDHEVDDNWAGNVPQDPELQTRAAFLARRAAALQAYYEHMPLRRSSLPSGSGAQLYRRLIFGDLVDLHLLDTRQHRSDQDRARRLDPTRTVLGAEQERWLTTNLAGGTARWNVLAQQVFFSQCDLTAGPERSFSADAWDGYVAARDALRDQLVAVGASNPVVVTGDVHAGYVCDVKADFDDPASATVATELVGTSMSSTGDGVDQGADDGAMLAENPHIRFVNRKRGYLRNVVTPSEWRADFRVVDHVSSPGAPISTRASFVIEAGRPGAVPA